MRRVFSRMTPRTRKTTSTAYRRYDFDHQHSLVILRRQFAESRAPTRPRPRTFLAYDSPRPPPNTRPPPRSRGPDPPIRRPCSGGSNPTRTFLQPERGGHACDAHLCRSRSGIVQDRARRRPTNSASASQACSLTSAHGRRACTGSRTESRWHPAPSQSGTRTYRVEDVREPVDNSQPPHPRTTGQVSSFFVTFRFYSTGKQDGFCGV